VIERWNSSAGACTGGTLRVFFEYWMSRLPLPLTTADRDHGCWCLNPALVTDTFSDLRHGVRHDRERGQRPWRSGLQAEPKLCHGFDLQKLRVELSLLGRVLGSGDGGIHGDGEATLAAGRRAGGGRAEGQVIVPARPRRRPPPLDHLHTVARHAGAPRRYSLFVILTGRGGGVVRAGS
jgi:hypothetical protein